MPLDIRIQEEKILVKSEVISLEEHEISSGNWHALAKIKVSRVIKNETDSTIPEVIDVGFDSKRTESPLSTAMFTQVGEKKIWAIYRNTRDESPVFWATMRLDADLNSEIEKFVNRKRHREFNLRMLGQIRSHKFRFPPSDKT